jgi:hypothetical protein
LATSVLSVFMMIGNYCPLRLHHALLYVYQSSISKQTANSKTQNERSQTYVKEE